MEITSALLVDEVRKHEDGRVDLLGLFEDIYLPSVPLTLDSLTLFLDLEIAPDDRGKRHALDLRLHDPAGQIVPPDFSITFEIPAEEDYPRATAQLDLDVPNVTFHHFGPHVIEVVLNNTPRRRVHLSIQPQNGG